MPIGEQLPGAIGSLRYRSVPFGEYYANIARCQIVGYFFPAFGNSIGIAHWAPKVFSTVNVRLGGSHNDKKILDCCQPRVFGYNRQPVLRSNY